MPTCFLNPAIDRLPFSISQCLTAHQFYFCEASHGTANIPTSGKTLNVVREINLKYTRGGRVSAPAPLKLIQMLVHRRCQDCELLIKQLSLNFASRKYLKQGGEARLWPRHKIVLKLTLCCILSLRREDTFSVELPLKGLFFILSEGVLRFLIECGVFESTALSIYVSFFLLFFDGTEETYCCSSSWAVVAWRRDWRTYVKCFKWFVTSYFSSRLAAFFTIKPEMWKKTLKPPDVQIQEYWKMHKKQVSDSSFLWRAYF